MDLVPRPGRVDVPQARVPPQVAAHPRHQLLRIEGLGDVVVRTHRESEHLVGVLALGAEHDDRQVAPLPQLHHRRQPVEPRHHHVDDHQPHRTVHRLFERLHPVVRPQHAVALLFEQQRDRLHDLPVVVDHQHAFVHLISPLGLSLS